LAWLFSFWLFFSSARQIVILGEVWRLGAAFREAVQPLGRFLGDVLFEAPRVSPRLKDLVDAVVFQSAIGKRVGQRLDQVRGVVAIAKGQDPAGMIARRAWQALLALR
jgi:hypothetical protein